jgi:hypothetical protein
MAVNLETGECKKQIAPNTYEQDGLDLLMNSFSLRRAAGKLLSPYRKTLENGRDVPIYRTVRCGCYVHKVDDGVGIWHTPEAKRAHFGNLVTCGSQWLCAVCSIKIALVRRGEAQLAVQRTAESGGVCGLLTLTIPHQAGDSFSKVLESIQRLYARWSSGRHSTAMKKNLPIRGSIRAVEVTKGVHGWHPHFHIVFFMSEPVIWAHVQDDFFARWASIAKKEFGWNLPRASLDLRGHASAGDYITKWSLEEEISMAHVKKGRGDSLTPFQLLSAYMEGDMQAGYDWREFATGVCKPNPERIKTTHRMVWSQGLKKELGLLELSDEQIADLQDKRALLLGTLTYDQWQKVLAQEYEVRPVLLTLATQGTFKDVLNYVNSLPDRALT